MCFIDLQESPVEPAPLNESTLVSLDESNLEPVPQGLEMQDLIVDDSTQDVVEAAPPQVSIAKQTTEEFFAGHEKIIEELVDEDDVDR